MRSNRTLIGVVTAAMLALGTAGVAPAEAHPRHDHGHHGGHDSAAAVRAWNEIAVTTLIGLPGPAGGAPPASQVHVAMVQGAVFDAVNAIGHSPYRSYLLEGRFSSRASQDAAVATAAYLTLRGIVASVPIALLPDATRTPLLDTLATQYADALADVPDGRAEAKGIEAGTAAAAAMIAARTDDGRFGPSQWMPNPAPGHWWPQTNPTTGQPVLDPTPWVGGVKPFVMRSSSQFRTAGPLALDSAAWAKDFNEVKDIGEADSATRSDDQTYIARWWQSNPVKSWNEVGRDLAERHGLGALDTARLLALQNLSGGDAAINCWNDKYYWDFWRPWNAIPRAAEDGNPATAPQADWLPLIAAPYPDHPSGHLCLDSAHATILRMYFGDAPRGGFTMTSVSTLITPQPSAARSFTSLTQVLDEVTEARIWAGLHYRTADLQGRGLGERVAWYAATHALQPGWHHRHHH